MLLEVQELCMNTFLQLPGCTVYRSLILSIEEAWNYFCILQKDWGEFVVPYKIADAGISKPFTAVMGNPQAFLFRRLSKDQHVWHEKIF